ncbi:MAG: response regulator, partial [Geodermatophilaceae bacterium]|nr:response regulator [Geodermatophilaceae bacterium]
FAVILLDVRMPTMDGFETAALIRQRWQSELTPIIFITAYASNEIAPTDRYVEGAVDFIFATIPPDELRAKVSVFANLFSKAETLATQAREIQSSADQWRLLSDAAPIGIFQTDTHNRYVYTNPRWTEITGISPDEATGRHWNTVFSSEQLDNLITEPSDPAVHPAESCHRVEIRLPDSANRIVLITSKSVSGIDGVISGWVGTLADVTAEAGAEAAMSEARDKATEASRLKSDFLANMSHEIRTPMNGVIGMTDLLHETGLDDRQRDYAQTVRNSGEALLTIINDILDFSKVEAGMLVIEDIEYDPLTILEDVVDLLAESALAKGLELVSVVDSSVPSAVKGDPGRVRRSSPTSLATPSSSPRPERSLSGPPRPTAWARIRSCASRSTIPATALRRTSLPSSFNPSCKPTHPHPGSTAAPAWGLPSAGSWWPSWVVTAACPAGSAPEASSGSRFALKSTAVR